MTFIVASNNAKKLKEITNILEGIGHDAVSATEYALKSNPEETADSFFGNALIKAQAFKALTPLGVIAEDSGLMVEALSGAPGVYTARYAGPNSTDEANIDKLLEEMKTVEYDDRTAWFVSSVVTILPDGDIISALGYTRGRIGFEKRGSNGFGYDPVFYIQGNRSFAQLTDRQKNEISHRGRALRKLAFKLRKIRRMKGNI
ncbi:MAG: RdgB/HAM1 family non-canonical purine NTP pyrophosphatase [Oscillospiraceae bacterium]|nr:RdgB/HAM1 family non-canonical purine NTP pyrophosphatase [Oscillospiraceae bacterium]